MGHKADIHEILSEKGRRGNYFVRVRKTQQTRQLFSDTNCSDTNLQVLCSFEFVRVRCCTRNSTVINLPSDYEEFVSLTRVRKDKASVRDLLTRESKAWMVVVKKFNHKQRSYNIGDVLQVRRGIARRFFDWIKTRCDQRYADYFHASVYPRHRCFKIPVKHLERNCKLCDSPSVRCNKSLGEVIETENEMPFALTIPFDPFTCSARRRSIENNSTSSYFERVIVDEIQRFEVFLTYLGDGNGSSLSAVVVPQKVTFDVEYSEDSTRRNSNEEFEYNVIRENLESLFLRIGIDEITVVNLEDYSRGHHPLDGCYQRMIHSNNCNQEYFISHEIEMQYSVECRTQRQKRDSSMGFVNEIPHSFLKDSSIDEGTFSDASGEEELEMISFGTSGKIEFVNYCSQGIHNEYLMPCTEYNNQYLRFKNTRKIRGNTTPSDDEESMTPENVVVGVDGYVQVNGGGGFSTANNSNTEPKSDLRKRFEAKNKCQIDFAYYQLRIFDDAHQGKPPVLPKALSLLSDQQNQQHRFQSKPWEPEHATAKLSTSSLSGKLATNRQKVPRQSRPVISDSIHSTKEVSFPPSVEEQFSRSYSNATSSKCTTSINSRINYFESTFQRSNPSI